MLTPGPDHPIVIAPAGRRWRVAFADHVIADTDNALILTEASLAPVIYFPREDVAMEYMSRTERSTHCPYKGDAAYYTILMDGQFAENAVWTYEQPYPAMDQICSHLAFYPDKVEVYAVDDATVNPHHADDAPADQTAVDQVVLHTDAGGGASQRETWAPTGDGGVR
ncbi:MAG: hypothetical protein JWO33_1296 [Caulobacteraceae bacterium]|nr:hypothetical protein [Caulobacteraceae bacterium]